MVTKTIYETRIFNAPGCLFFIKVYSKALAAIKELNRVKSMTENEGKNTWRGYVTELRLNNESYTPGKVIDCWE